MNWRAAMAAVGVGLFAAGMAQAADPAGVMGKWVERFPNGKAMVSEFTPKSIASYSVDEAGKPLGAVNTAAVTYKDLGGDLVGVQFAGASASAIMLQRTGPNSITMDFPGVGAHKLTRLSQ